MRSLEDTGFIEVNAPRAVMCLSQGLWMFQVSVNDGIGGTKRKGKDRHRGMSRKVLRKGRPTQHKEIRDVPVLKERIHNGGLARGPHNRASLHVGTLIARAVIVPQARVRKHFTGTHRLGNLDRFWDRKFDHFAFVVRPVESQPKQRISQMVRIRWIEVHEVPFVSHVLSKERDAADAIEVMDRSLFPLRAPTSFY